MDEEEKNQRVWKAPESEFVLQWGNRKRLRGPRVKDFEFSDKSNGGIRRKITSRIDRLVVTASEKESSHFLQPTRFTRNSEGAVLRSNGRENENENENGNGNGKISRMEGNGGGFVWPKLCITLSSKEKEEDFMAMKGCKPPQRPKKRAKIIQRSILLVSPGAWLSDMSLERYEVREKKTSKKRPRGLKAMGSKESDSE